MTAGIDNIRQTMADYLNERGVPALTAWPMTAREENESPVVVVSLRGCRAVPAGFGDYLGDRFDGAQSRWEEHYGRRGELTLGLDIYAPLKGDGQAVQTAFDALAAALILGGPAGLEVGEFSCGQTVYDGESRRLKRPVEAKCLACLAAVADAGGGFTDFILRGAAHT